MSNSLFVGFALVGFAFKLEFNYLAFDELTVEYKCDCSYDRTRRAIVSLGKAEIDSIFAEKRDNGEEEKIELECHFCDKKYVFTKEDTDKLF